MKKIHETRFQLDQVEANRNILFVYSDTGRSTSLADQPNATAIRLVRGRQPYSDDRLQEARERIITDFKFIRDWLELGRVVVFSPDIGDTKAVSLKKDAPDVYSIIRGEIRKLEEEYNDKTDNEAD